MRYIKYIYYRLLWHLAPILPHGKFIHLDLELNNTCNQKCIFCWHSEGNLKKEIMPIEKINECLTMARWMGALSVKFNLRGEPLLSHQLVNACRKASSLGFIEIMINTNGSLIDAGNLIPLESAGLTKMIISVDSFDKDTYEKLHRYEFEKIFKNLCVVQSLKKQNIITFKTEINIHINEHNKHEDFLRFVKFFYTFKFNIRDTANRQGEHIAVDRGKRKRKVVCPHMMRRLTVHAGGEVYPCCVSYNKPKDIELYDYYRVDVAWQGIKRFKLLKNYVNGIYPDTCKNCTSNDIYDK